MAELAIQLTPPRPGTVEAQMQPQEFLISDPTIERIKRKASLPDISPTAKQRLRLEPQAKDDMTLAQYQKHVMHTCSRQELMVMIPVHKLWPRMQAEITKLREDSNNHKDLTCGLRTRVEEQERTIEELKRIFEEHKRMFEEHKRTTKKLEARTKATNGPQLDLFKGNAVVDLAKLLNKRVLNENDSTIHLQQLAANATEKQLIKAEIPKKYWRIIRNLPALIIARNKSAHESEINFARFLISEGPDTHNYQYWKEIFPLLYGGTLEEVAGRETTSELNAKLEF